MKDRTANALRKMAELTCRKCEQCPVPPQEKENRCCDKGFCQMAEQYMRHMGYPVPKHTGHKIPFMGARGCIITPEHRPFCTTFVCPERLKEDRQFRRSYQKLRDKIEADTDATPIPFRRLEEF